MRQNDFRSSGAEILQIGSGNTWVQQRENGVAYCLDVAQTMSAVRALALAGTIQLVQVAPQAPLGCTTLAVP